MHFGRETWSVQIPAGWEAWHDAECASMEPPTQLGALQVSAAFKDSPVSDEDLKDFASSDIEASGEPNRVAFGPFCGFHIARAVDGTYWRKWYLRHESQALFVTYNCGIGDRGVEDAAVIEVLGSLSARGVTPPNKSLERTREG